MTKKLQKVAAVVPTSIDEVNDWVGKIAGIQNEVNQIEVDLNAEVLSLQSDATEKAAPLKAEIEKLFAGIYSYCEANRLELTNNGKIKSVELPSGQISWRFNPPSVKTKSGLKVADLIAILRRHRLGRFVRPKYEVDKEAILKNPGSVIGIPEISIVQDEVFSVKPNELTVEISEPTEKLKKRIA